VGCAGPSELGYQRGGALDGRRVSVRRAVVLFVVLLLLGAPAAATADESPNGLILEVAGCGSEEWQIIRLNDVVTFQHGIGFGTLEEAIAERDGETAVFLLDGVPLIPVYFEGLTEHAPGFYGDRARADWLATPGTHTVQSYWTHPNEAFPGDVCEFDVVVRAMPSNYRHGVGELKASFHGGLSGGNAVQAHSGVASGLASPATNPEGRLEPFGGVEEVCHDTVVGTWVFYLASDGGDPDGWTTELRLDGALLELERTPWKPRLDGSGDKWYAEGVPVLGTLDPGTHYIYSFFSNTSGLEFGPWTTEVEVTVCG